MYTVNAVAEKTGAKPAEVRYFARKYNGVKIILENKQTFVFDKKDYRRFLLYQSIIKEKKEDKSSCIFHFMMIPKPLYKSKIRYIKKCYSVKKRLLKNCALYYKRQGLTAWIKMSYKQYYRLIKGTLKIY